LINMKLEFIIKTTLTILNKKAWVVIK
jgi:hypothetical protein